jgi:hypothetical protein
LSKHETAPESQPKTVSTGDAANRRSVAIHEAVDFAQFQRPKRSLSSAMLTSSVCYSLGDNGAPAGEPGVDLYLMAIGSTLRDSEDHIKKENVPVI